MNLPYFEVQIRTLPAAIFTITLLITGFLGLSPSSSIVPVHDKFQHFFCFFLLSLSFYWILDVSKKKATQFTTITMVAASIASEYLQAILTPRQFDPVDIAANLVGSMGALILSSTYHTRMLQRRRAAKYAVLNAARTDDMEMGAVDGEAELETNETEHAATEEITPVK